MVDTHLLSQILNPPLTFVIDTTKSVKPDKDSIFNLTRKVVDGIKNDNINIPRYCSYSVYRGYKQVFLRFMLVSFNDFGREINLNVQIEVGPRSLGQINKPHFSYFHPRLTVLMWKHLELL